MKHYFALRMMNVENRIFEKLFLYSAASESFTMSDFEKVNSNNCGYRLMFPMYVGYTTKEDALSKHKDIGWILFPDEE